MKERLRSWLLSYTHRFVSRWVILFLDMLIITTSFLIAYLLRFNFDIEVVMTHSLLSKWMIFSLAFLVAFFLFQPFRGIVRQTSLYDAFLVFYSSTLAVAMLFTFNMIVQFSRLPGNLHFSAGKLLIAYLVSMFLLVFLRLLIKVIYIRMVKRHDPIERFLIFGAGEMGVSAMQAINSSMDGRLKVVGFIDDNETKIHKYLNGVRIYPESALTQKFLEENNILALILAVNNLSPQRRVQIIEKCLELNLEVRTVPRVGDWAMGQLSFKQIRKVEIEDLLARETISVNNGELTSFIGGKVVLVTGAAGSIGSELCRQIYKLQPAGLIMLDNAETPLFNLEQSFAKTSTNGIVEKAFVMADITQKQTLRSVFETYRPVVVFHAAAYKHVPVMERNPLEALRVNVFGTASLVEMAKEHGVERFVFISTDKAVNPTSVMGASKRAAELIVQRQNLDPAVKTTFITTRFGNVLGSNGSVIPIFEKQIAKGGPVTVTHPDMIRYFMTIPEACELVLEASVMGNGGEIFVFDMGQQQKIVDLAVKMIKLSGLIPYYDIDIVFSGLRPGEKLYEELFNDCEENITTHHPKIMIASSGNYPYHILDRRLHSLSIALEQQEPVLAKKVLVTIVPEYKIHEEKSIYA